MLLVLHGAADLQNDGVVLIVGDQVDHVLKNADILPAGPVHTVAADAADGVIVEKLSGELTGVRQLQKCCQTVEQAAFLGGIHGGVTTNDDGVFLTVAGDGHFLPELFRNAEGKGQAFADLRIRSRLADQLLRDGLANVAFGVNLGDGNLRVGGEDHLTAV